MCKPSVRVITPVHRSLSFLEDACSSWTWWDRHDSALVLALYAGATTASVLAAYPYRLLEDWGVLEITKDRLVTHRDRHDQRPRSAY